VNDPFNLNNFVYVFLNDIIWFDLQVSYIYVFYWLPRLTTNTVTLYCEWVIFYDILFLTFFEMFIVNTQYKKFVT